MRQVRASRVPNGSIVIDGVAAESAWKDAVEVSGFVQREPRAGEPPTEQTAGAIAYDDHALYVFLRASDSRPQSITGQLTPRDEESPSDFLEVWLDPQNDRLTAYVFAVSSKGVQVDTKYSKGGEEKNPTWNAVWNSAVSRNADGWSAELRIPWSQLRYDGDAESWGIQLVRRLNRVKEASVLEPTPMGASRPLLHTARLTGIQGLPPAIHLELLPYVAMAVERSADYDYRLRAGGDARVALGSTSTLQLTINPDFGQVEQDPSELNLTAFETFLTERRQFFVDGQEAFDFSLVHRDKTETKDRLYYSRRIGAAPARDLGLDAGQVRKYPRQTTIFGAAKVVGRTSHGLSYSGLTALTGRERAETVVDGVRDTPVVTSPTNFSVIRLRQELGRNGSSVGMMATDVYRHLDSPLRPEEVKRASVGAADFDLRLGDYGLVGNVVGSYLSGTSLAIDAVQRSSHHYLQRPDAYHLNYDPQRRHMAGYGAGILAGKLSGTDWRASIGGQLRSPSLELNDLGYLRRADHQVLFAKAELRGDRANNYFRWYVAEVSVWGEQTFAAENIGRSAAVRGEAGWNNNWYGWVGAVRRTEAMDVSLLRGGPAFLKPGGFGAWFGIATDDRRAVSATLEGTGDYDDQASYKNVYLRMTTLLRMSSALSIVLIPAYQRSLNDLQYVAPLESAPDRIFLGRMSQETLSLTLRASWALALGLTLQGYAMPFVSAAYFQRFYRLGDPLAARYEDRRIDTRDYSGEDRLLKAQIRSNVVLRWDYLPGSSVFLAWSHEQLANQQHGAIEFGRELPLLLRSPATDIVFLKWIHYVGL